MTNVQLPRRWAMALVLLTSWSGGAAWAENWPGWRGPQRSGVSGESNLPTRWSETQAVAWKTPLPGFGISNPVIWDDAVVVTASDGKDFNTLHVIRLDRDSGEKIWHARFWGTSPTRHHNNKSSMASPAPVTDGENIYAFFGSGDLFCVDMNGGLRWQRSLAAEFGKFENRFAASSAPLLYRDMVLLQCDHYGDSYLIALDKKTGAIRWKTDRPDAWLSWSSPQLVEVKGRHELVVCGSLKVDAFDPLTGERLWTVGGMRRECIPTPVVAHGRVYVASGPSGPSMAIRPGGRGDVTRTHVVWSNARGAPFVPSAIVVGDYYYLVDDKGIATCLGAHDGRLRWQKRLRGRFTASPVAGDGKIYFVNEAGETTVIRAGIGKYVELAKNPLHEPVYASPAISGGHLFLRTAKHLICIGPKASSP